MTQVRRTVSSQSLRGALQGDPKELDVAGRLMTKSVGLRMKWRQEEITKVYCGSKEIHRIEKNMKNSDF